MPVLMHEYANLGERLWTPGVDQTDTGISRSQQLYYAEAARLDPTLYPMAEEQSLGNKWTQLMVEGRELLVMDPADWSVGDFLTAQEIVGRFSAKLKEYEILSQRPKTVHGPALKAFLGEC